MADLDPQTPPECFSRIEKVFPMGADGLRQPSPECFECGIKTECLRSAVAGEDGLVVHEERLARAYQAGAVGFLERWAQQKHLEGRKKNLSRWRSFWMRWQRFAR
jgi:hypothetical protein